MLSSENKHFNIIKRKRFRVSLKIYLQEATSDCFALILSQPQNWGVSIVRHIGLNVYWVMVKKKKKRLVNKCYRQGILLVLDGKKSFLKTISNNILHESEEWLSSTENKFGFIWPFEDNIICLYYTRVVAVGVWDLPCSLSSRLNELPKFPAGHEAGVIYRLTWLTDSVIRLVTGLASALIAPDSFLTVLSLTSS